MDSVSLPMSRPTGSFMAHCTTHQQIEREGFGLVVREVCLNRIVGEDFRAKMITRSPLKAILRHTAIVSYL